jgi:polyferredoxin
MDTHKAVFYKNNVEQQQSPENQADLIIGSSRFSQKLRQEVNRLCTTLEPIFIQGNSGTGVTFIAQLIHRKSALSKECFLEINCNLGCTNLCPSIAEKQDSKLVDISPKSALLGLIKIEAGTIVLKNAHLLQDNDWEYLQLLINNKKEQIRLIFTSPNKLNTHSIHVKTLKVCDLSKRREDILDLANCFISKFCGEKGRSLLQFNQASLRRLISYDYPGNIAELESIIKRLVLMTPNDETILTEKLLWSLESQKNAFRLDLLNQFPWLRQFLLSKWYPDAIWIVVMAIFIPITIMGFFGPQTRSDNVILNLFWAWWWPLYLLLFPLLGRFWCSVCPFMITGEWIRNLSLWIFPRQQLSWQTTWLNKWGAWFVFLSFAAIYLWEKLWDLPHTPYLSAWLFVIITAGAVIFSLIYEHRLWCRYLCPIGGMNGMFAKLSIIELRSTQAVCGSLCENPTCYKGGESNTPNFGEALLLEGQETEGCPLNLGPGKLTDNRNCILCMGCVKACPNRSVQLNLRFPGSDLWQNHQGFWAEIALMLLIFGGVFLHYSELILGWFNLEYIRLDSEHLLSAIPLAILFLSIPFILTYSVHKIASLLSDKVEDYKKVIYAYLYMTLSVTVAYHFPSAVTEAGYVLPVFARTFGYNGVSLPILAWSEEVATFLQDSVLIVGLLTSIYFLFKITKTNFLKHYPHLFLMISFTLFFMYI